MAVARTSRSEREQRILAATRTLFDARGLQEAPMDAVAREAGVDKAVIYRHFASQEELYVSTLCRYLDELGDLLRAVAPAAAPAERFRATSEAYVDFCIAHPAFIDCSLSLLRHPWEEISARVGEGVWLRLGRGMAACLGPFSDLLRELGVEAPEFTANHLYTQALGTLHLARIGVGVADGPRMFALDATRVREAVVDDALRTVGLPVSRSPAGPR